MAEQPLALQWLCFIRDHGVDLKVTLGERALASLLPTYGQGKNIYVPMKSLARVTGWSRNTVTKHRDGLIAKGLLEDITGDPDKQVRTYRLTVPGYVTGAQILSTPAQILSTPAQILSTSCSDSEHNIKPSDQAGESSNTSPSPAAPDDDGDGASLEGQEQGQEQAPVGPRPAGADSDQDDQEKIDPDFGGIVWNDPEDGGGLADSLGVPLASIGKPFRAWFDGLCDSGQLHCQHDYLAIHHAAKDSAGKKRPVGYLKTILPTYVAEFREVGANEFHARHRRDAA